jgi:apolipoprotein D and lipocalin family protein
MVTPSKAWGNAVALALIVLLSGCARESTRPLAAVKSVDASRYAGRWYEIARLPNRFQRDDSLATADYTVQKPGVLGVLNTERRPDGSTGQIRGTATAVPDSGGSRLRVKFEGPAGLIPVPADGNYWIIGLTSDYSMSLVGTPNRKFLWLLARRPGLSANQRQRFLEIAKRQGFDTEKVIVANWKR